MSALPLASSTAFSGSLRSLTEDYKAPSPGASIASGTSSKHDMDELNVTLGQSSSSARWSEGRKKGGSDVSFFLNASSTTFTPFASPPRTMPDIGNLTFSDQGSVQGDQLVGQLLGMAQMLPPKIIADHKPAPVVTPQNGLKVSTLGSSFRTPDLTSSTSRASTWSRWDFAPATSSPYTPFTPLPSKGSSIKQPITPPSFTAFQPSASLIGLVGKEKGKSPEVLSGGGYEGGVLGAEEVGRYLMITNIAPDITAQDIKNVIKRLARFKILIAKHLQSKGCVTIVFFDSREAAKVYNYLQTHTVALYANSPLVELHCIVVSREDVESDANTGPAWQDFWQDVESAVVIEIQGAHGVTLDVMRSVCEKVGAVQHLQEIGTGGKEYLVDFWDTRHATEIVETLNNRASGGMTVRARLYSFDEPQASLSANREFRRAQSGPAQFSSTGSAAGDRDHRLHGFVPHTPARMLFTSPGSTNQVQDDVFGPFKPINANAPADLGSAWPAPHTPPQHSRQTSSAPARPSLNETEVLPRPYGSYNTPAVTSRAPSMERRISKPDTGLASGSKRFESPSHLGIAARRETAYGSPSSGIGGGLGKWAAGGSGWNKKMISPDKRINLQMIEHGQEIRTTVMVKDVPNKLSRQELVDILCDVVPGGFDFVYLRFDFKNACNVGYAFVNFTSPDALLKFHMQRVGQKWNMFSSEKVLQICWADIQGKERLINKFRNSDVMTAPEPWRPQIFYSSGPLQGCPEPFPEPDHPSRMRSSFLRHTPSSNGDYAYDTANDYNYTSADFDASYGY